MGGFKEKFDNELSMKDSSDEARIRKTVWVGKMSKGMEKKQI